MNKKLLFSIMIPLLLSSCNKYQNSNSFFSKGSANQNSTIEETGYYAINTTNKITLNIGQEYILTPRISSKNNSVSYEYDASLISISNNKIKALSKGTCTLIGKVNNGTNELKETLTIEIIDEEKSDKGSIDLIIVSGQSNAIGNSIYSEEKADTNMKEGYDSIKINIVAGSYQKYTNNYYDWQNVKLGQGDSNKKIGPEIGIAKALNDTYSQNNDSTFGIIKVATGGVHLLEDEGLLTDKSRINDRMLGNFASPSYLSTITPQSPNCYSGGMYRALINSTFNAIESLQAKGYSKINLKGMYWMQGEADRKHPDEYKKAFSYFVQDFRNDIGKLLSVDASSLWILVGEISKTFASANDDDISINEKFINMQNSLKDDISNIEINHSSNYKMNDLIDGKNVVLGSDEKHWNQDDCISIGQEVGNWVLSLNENEDIKCID